MEPSAAEFVPQSPPSIADASTLLQEAWVREGIMMHIAKQSIAYGDYMSQCATRWQNDWNLLHDQYLVTMQQVQTMVSQQRDAQPHVLENILLREENKRLKRIIATYEGTENGEQFDSMECYEQQDVQLDQQSEEDDSE